MKEVKLNWKSLGWAHGPITSLNSKYEFNIGGFFTVYDKDIAIGFVLYLGRIYISAWRLK